jgi:hypothetical protein
LYRLSTLRLALNPAGNKPCLDVAASPNVNLTLKNCPKLSKIAFGPTSISSCKIVSKKQRQLYSDLNLRTSGADLRDRRSPLCNLSLRFGGVLSSSCLATFCA